MDPDAALAKLIDAAVEGDTTDLLNAADDLASWLDHGGFAPSDPRKDNEA